MSRLTKTLLLGSAVLFAQTMAAPAQAGRLIAYAYTQGSGGYVDSYQDDSTGPNVASVGTAAAATADYGVLKFGTNSTVSANGVGPYATETVFASAYFEDGVTINSGAPGTAGVATFAISIDGSIGSSSSGPGMNPAFDNSFSVNILATGSGINSRYGEVVPLRVFFNTSSSGNSGSVRTNGSYDSNGNLAFANTTSLTNSSQAIGTFSFDIPFISGQSFLLAATGRCQSDQYSSRSGVGTSTTDCSFGHTVNWGGLLGVRDSSGGSVNLTSITAASGVNYADNFGGAVPEPATWAMMIIGFGAAGSMIRRRKAVVA